VFQGLAHSGVCVDGTRVVAEMIEGVIGLINLLSTWRFVICAAAGVIGIYATTFVVEARVPRLVLCGVVLLVALWSGSRWQMATERRRRSNGKPVESRSDGAP